MNKPARMFLLMLIDVFITVSAIYLSYVLRFDFDMKYKYSSTLPYVAISYTLIMIACLYVFKIYKRLWEHASIGDVISIFKAVAAGSSIFFLYHYLVIQQVSPKIVVPRSIYIMSAMIIFLGVAGSRFCWRIFRDNYNKIQPHHRRALIIGAGNTGLLIAKELKHSNSEYYPVAFIDDDYKKQNLEVLGIPVLGSRKDIPDVVREQRIQDIVLALPSASRLDISNILEICKTTGCQIKIMPRVNDLINGKITLNMIRNVSVEDLLGRDPVKADLQEIANYVSGQVVLITGAGGSIGSELCRQISNYHPKKLILLGHGENSIYEIELELKKTHSELAIVPVIADIQDRHRINDVFQKYRPNVVFHAAAHKHVPIMESNPIEAIKNNILGTRNVAECSHDFNVNRFVMISTDKAVNPTNVMGATKRIAEMIIQSLDQISETRFAAVRFGNVLGSRGSVVPVFKRQIREGGPVTVTHPEMIRYFMTIPEAVQLVIQTGALASGGEVFILDMGQPVKIADLAKDLIRLSGLEPGKDIDIVYTGIRPGEKLFEELLTNEEGTSATKHDRIFVGKPGHIPFEELKVFLHRFEQIILSKDYPQDEEIKQILKHLVPSYNYKVDQREAERILNESLRASLEVVAAIENK